ncbi:MAG: PA2779 family protein [Burkholderiales bacterium]|nr:PA2779 family protein [Burkholderiales bacterium]
MNRFNRAIARLLVICTFALGLPLPAAADIVTTDQIYASSERERVRSFLEREDVRSQIQSFGVDADAAKARVNALSDQEIGELAGRIDELPAGAGIVGVLFTVFIVLLVTDILGLTKVFPFTRSVR